MSTPAGPVPPDDTPPRQDHAPVGLPATDADDRPEGTHVGAATEGRAEHRTDQEARDGAAAASAPAGDDGDAADDDLSGRDPLRFNRWMRSSASGGILTGIALGLQHALEGRREQPAFVMEAPGEPEDPDAPISLHFDPDDPTKTVAVIRSPSDQERGGGAPPPAGDA